MFILWKPGHNPAEWCRLRSVYISMDKPSGHMTHTVRLHREHLKPLFSPQTARPHVAKRLAGTHKAERHRRASCDESLGSKSWGPPWHQFNGMYIANQNLKSENQSPESEKENSESGTRKLNSVNESAIRKRATEEDGWKTEMVLELIERKEKWNRERWLRSRLQNLIVGFPSLIQTFVFQILDSLYTWPRIDAI